MNKAQKEVLKYSVKQEKQAIKELKQLYKKARQDVAKNISILAARKDTQNLQSIVYQRRYQEMILKQINTALSALESGQYDTVSKYIKGSYETGYLGTMYDIHKQGIPVIVPIDQKQVTKAIRLDSKLSKKYYSKEDPAKGRMKEDIKYLKNSVRAEVSRGIANGSTWNQMAARIANGMNSRFDVAYNSALRIARTEGHRVQNSAAFDAQTKAKESGADILKQWDATLDGATRPHHRELDGQIRETEETFTTSDGAGAMYPGGFGDPSEDCNCRCALLQRARWGLDQSELDTLKERAEYFGLDKSEDFSDFAEKYLNAVDNSDNIEPKKEIEHSEAYNHLKEGLERNNVGFMAVSQHAKQPTEEQIIKALSGGDMTKGSCSSLGFAYIGNKNGLNVTDFRGGNSQSFFSMNGNIGKILELPNIKGSIIKVKKEAADTAKIIGNLEHNKEYYLAVGRHAAIIRNTKNGAEYLELQSATKSGWTPFDKYGSTITTLRSRFGCRKTIDRQFGKVWEKNVVLMEVDSFKENDEFKDILGYINTAADKQKKGGGGYEK